MSAVDLEAIATLAAELVALRAELEMTRGALDVVVAKARAVPSAEPTRLLDRPVAVSIVLGEAEWRCVLEVYARGLEERGDTP